MSKINPEFEPVRYADGSGLPPEYEAIHQTIEFIKVALDHGDSSAVDALIAQIPVAGEEEAEIQLVDSPGTLNSREINLLFRSPVSRRLLPGILDREDELLARASHKR